MHSRLIAGSPHQRQHLYFGRVEFGDKMLASAQEEIDKVTSYFESQAKAA
jgi:hypothetical protein